MTDLDDLDLMGATTPATINVTTRRHVHRYIPAGYVTTDYPVVGGVATLPTGATIESSAQVVRVPTLSPSLVCARCGKVRDESVTRRNRNNRNRGSAFERTVAKKLGGRRTGPLGGRDDVQVGSFAAVQTKKSHSFSLTQARTYLDDLQRAFPDKVALVVHGKPGRPSDPVVILTLEAWVALHGGDGVE